MYSTRTLAPTYRHSNPQESFLPPAYTVTNPYDSYTSYPRTAPHKVEAEILETKILKEAEAAQTSLIQRLTTMATKFLSPPFRSKPFEEDDVYAPTAFSTPTHYFHEKDYLLPQVIAYATHSPLERVCYFITQMASNHFARMGINGVCDFMGNRLASKKALATTLFLTTALADALHVRATSVFGRMAIQALYNTALVRLTKAPADRYQGLSSVEVERKRYLRSSRITLTPRWAKGYHVGLVLTQLFCLRVLGLNPIRSAFASYTAHSLVRSAFVK